MAVVIASGEAAKQSTCEIPRPRKQLAGRNLILTTVGETGAMVPMRNNMIFKSRWMALLWAAGIIWAALSLTSEDQSADLTGATISDADARNFAEL